MRRCWLLLTHRVGRRGASLLFLAIVDLLYGFSLAVPGREAAQSPTVRFIDQILPLPAWAVLWTAVGVVLLVGAFTRRDWWAFCAAVALKVLWGVTLLAGWLIGMVDRGWVAAAIWLPMAVWVFIIGGWPEPEAGDGRR